MDILGPAARGRLLAAGHTDGELRRRRAAGELATVRRGVYCPAEDERLREPIGRHRLLVDAVLEGFAEVVAVSHVSAAVLLGLPLWHVRLDRVHLTRRGRRGGRVGRGVHLHTAPLPDGDVVVAGEHATTSPARTVVDLARTLPFEEAVVIADGVLGRRLATRAELTAAVAHATGWPGAPAARRVLAFADARSESVAESRSRVALHRAGLPVPVPQWDVYAGASWLGRVDFGWPDLHTVGEFDGKVKYGRLLRPGQAPGDAVFEEKLREDALRDEGLRVVRWTWHDLEAFDTVTQRLHRAFRT